MSEAQKQIKPPPKMKATDVYIISWNCRCMAPKDLLNTVLNTHADVIIIQEPPATLKNVRAILRDPSKSVRNPRAGLKYRQSRFTDDWLYSRGRVRIASSRLPPHASSKP